MPQSYVIALAVAGLLAVAAGLVLRVLRGQARPRPVDGVLVMLGWLGLGLHCGAMFGRAWVTWIPGSTAYVDAVNGMGPGSVVLYVVPAALLLVGLRRARRPLLAACALALVAVGITMYDGGSLPTHLTAIFTGVVLGAAASAGLAARAVRPPD